MKRRPRKLTVDKAAAINRKRDLIQPRTPGGGTVVEGWPRELVVPGRARGVREYRVTLRTDGGRFKPLPQARLSDVVCAAAVLGAKIEITTVPIPGWKPPRRKR